MKKVYYVIENVWEQRDGSRRWVLDDGYDHCRDIVNSVEEANHSINVFSDRFDDRKRIQVKYEVFIGFYDEDDNLIMNDCCDGFEDLSEEEKKEVEQLILERYFRKDRFEKVEEIDYKDFRI